ATVEAVAGAVGLSDTTPSQEETFWAIRRLLAALAAEQPLLVVFDDIHWAEPTFLDLVEYLGGAREQAPMLLLCMARPELRDLRPALTGNGVPSVLLEPLDAGQSKS